jgi:hypothetical protein
MLNMPHVLAHAEHTKTLLHIENTISACNTHPTTTAGLHTECILTLSHTEHTTTTLSHTEHTTVAISLIKYTTTVSHKLPDT